MYGFYDELSEEVVLIRAKDMDGTVSIERVDQEAYSTFNHYVMYRDEMTEEEYEGCKNAEHLTWFGKDIFNG